MLCCKRREIELQQRGKEGQYQREHITTPNGLYCGWKVGRGVGRGVVVFRVAWDDEEKGKVCGEKRIRLGRWEKIVTGGGEEGMMCGGRASGVKKKVRGGGGAGCMLGYVRETAEGGSVRVLWEV